MWLAAATVTAAASAVVVADEQQDDQNEHQPAAVGLAAKQITQTHKRTLLYRRMRGSAAAGAAAGVGRVTAVAAVAITAIVEDQDESDDEQQPRAVDVTAKQIAQTHIVSSFPKAAYGAFISIL